jgi:hypothetical protein
MHALRDLSSSRKRLALAVLAVTLVVALAAGVAYAYVMATVASGGNGGSTAGSLPAGNTPSVSLSGGNVTVSWTQSSVGGQFLGSYTGGGYTVKRYPASGGSAVTPGASCNTTIGGSSSISSCTESSVPSGSWRYTITPVLNSWTGGESAQSAAVSIASIALSPTSGHVGDTVTIGGSNFPANSTITATYGGSALTLSGTTTTAAAGAIPAGVTFTVPASVAGAHTVQVTAGGQSATATFTVTPAITLNPTSGGAGSADAIGGTGFAATSSIGATFGGSPVTLSGTTTTDATGSFAGASYTVPGDAAGKYTVVVTDGSTSHNNASTSYTVTFGPVSKLALSAATTNPTAGAADDLTLAAEDANGNTVASYTGSHSLTFGGANAIGTHNPTVTSSSGSAIAFGSPTAINFTTGVALVSGSSNGAMTLYKAGSTSITVTDGTINNSASLLSVFVNSAGVTLSYSSTCPLSVPKNGSATFSINFPNDSFGNPFTTQSSAAFGLALSSGANFGFGVVGTTATTLNVTTGPANNSFTIAESGKSKTTNLTMPTVPTGFTAPGICVVNSSS